MLCALLGLELPAQEIQAFLQRAALTRELVRALGRLLCGTRFTFPLYFPHIQLCPTENVRNECRGTDAGETERQIISRWEFLFLSYG